MTLLRTILAAREPQRRGYQGFYDSVHQHVQAWNAERRGTSGDPHARARFAGEAFQFDWGEQTVTLGAQTARPASPTFGPGDVGRVVNA
jgi:hypothetical protein